MDPGDAPLSISQDGPPALPDRNGALPPPVNQGGAGPAWLGAGLRLGGSLMVGLCGLGATLLAALPGVAAGLLLLLDRSLGGSLDVVRGLIAGLLWPGPGFGLLQRPSLMTHPLAAGLWSLASAALGLAGTAMSLAEWRLGRPGWRAALPAWAASAWCGGVPVAVLLAPAAAMQLVGIAVARRGAGVKERPRGFAPWTPTKG